MTVVLFGVPIYEFDVAVTDFLLFLESLAFAALLFRQATAHTRLRNLVAALFLWLGISSLLGAVFHGFFPEKDNTAGGHLVWMLTGLSIGVTASVVWYVNAWLVDHRGFSRAVAALVPVFLTVFAYVLGFVSHDFLTIIFFYAPPLALLAAVGVWTWLRLRSAEWLYLVLGTLLSFAAAGVQALHIDLHP